MLFQIAFAAPGTVNAARLACGSSGGFTSTGPGPKEFPGVPVARFCIRTDLACDATTPVSAYTFFLTDTHRRYANDGNVMTRTIANDGADGVFWYES